MGIESEIRDCGGFYCPYISHQRLIVRSLQSKAASAVPAYLPYDMEWRSAFDVFMTLIGYLLANVMGLRMLEICDLWRGEVDLYAGRVGILGKRDRLHVRNRVLPIPFSMRGLLAYGLYISCVVLEAHRFQVEDKMPFLWMYSGREAPRPVTRRDLQDCLGHVLQGAGIRGGLPRWHSGRYALQTCLTERGLAFDEANYILGHQITGLDATNPFVRFDWAGMESRYLMYTDELLEELGYEPGLFELTADS